MDLGGTMTQEDKEENQVEDENYERLVSSYYGKGEVTALMMFKVETKEANSIAKQLVEFNNIEDVYLVTGDTDIYAKAHFESYKDMRSFVLDSISKIDGVKDISTLMAVAIYKDKDNILELE